MVPAASQCCPLLAVQQQGNSSGHLQTVTDCSFCSHTACYVAGSPALGSRGTVVGMHEGALEVLFDSDFVGGGDLQGRCQGRCGLMIAPADLLNLAKPHFSNITGSEAPRQIGRSSQSSWLTTPGQAKKKYPNDVLLYGSGRGQLISSFKYVQ